MLGWEYPPEISGGLGVACHGLAYGLSLQNVSIDFVLPKVKAKKTWKKVKLREVAEVEWRKVLAEEKEWWEEVRMLEIGSYLAPYVSPDRFPVTEVKELTKTRLKTEPLYKKLKGGYGPDLFMEVAKYAVVIGEEAANTSADIIHAHDWMTYQAGVMAKAASGKPLVVHCHSTEFDRAGIHVNQHIYNIERNGFEEADVVIAVSNQTRQLIHKHYSIPLSKIKVVHNGYFPVQREKMVNRKTFTVAFLGRMVNQKGPEHFVDVARELLRLDDSYRFVMAGDGPLLDAVRYKVERMNLSPYFALAGFLKPQLLPSFFGNADLLLLTSNSDPFGLVALEACSAGVPVVLSNKSGVCEVLESAQCFDPWDTYSIKNFIDELRNDPKKLKEYIRKQQKDLKSASWENMGEEVNAIYKKLLP